MCFRAVLVDAGAHWWRRHYHPALTGWIDFARGNGERRPESELPRLELELERAAHTDVPRRTPVDEACAVGGVDVALVRDICDRKVDRPPATAQAAPIRDTRVYKAKAGETVEAAPETLNVGAYPGVGVAEAGRKTFETSFPERIFDVCRILFLHEGLLRVGHIADVGPDVLGNALCARGHTKRPRR